ncbi:hypothetical protein [Bosea sp. (in: a-proteobacteria)]|uniref:hypothetical protein n=1 Tax=Bosea sp. (in: a-proteobacteria) TaxID=1871050 RepID=UPI003341A035
MDRTGSVVPLIPLRDIGEVIRRIEDLKAFVDRAGFGSIGYFLEIALSEARHQQEQEEHSRRAKGAKPSDLWLPEG